MDLFSDLNNICSVRTEEEYRKLAYIFPEYLFLDKDYCICMAGRNIEELLNYSIGSLRNKHINFISNEDDLKSSLMIQISENFFEWRSYSLKSFTALKIDVEICGLRIGQSGKKESCVIMRIRNSRNHLERAASPEVNKLTYWIAHNLRGPLATIKGLINLAKIEKSNSEMNRYLNHMAQQAERLDEKIQLMIRMANKIVK